MATLQEVQAQHPDWNVVQVIPDPSGTGTLALGADGGVFALEGATYRGSYNDLAPEQRQGTRSFTDIKLDQAGTGYTLVSNVPGQEYSFGGTAKPPPTTTTTPPPGPGAEEAKSAKAILAAALEQYGLPASLIDKLWEPSLKMSAPEITQLIRGSEEYKVRYPGMETLRKNGRAISEAEYQSTETQIKQTMSYYGLPAGFYDSPDDFAKLIGGEVSPKEFEDRIQMAASMAYTAPPELRQEAERYGLSSGDIVAYFLDPPTAEEAIKRRYLYQQAEIGVASKQSGFGALTKDEAERLRAGGLTADQAGQRLGEVGAYNPLTQATAEESALGTGAKRSDLIDVATGDEAKKRELEKAARKRQAAFAGGGGAAGSSQGSTGIGSSR